MNMILIAKQKKNSNHIENKAAYLLYFFEIFAKLKPVISHVILYLQKGDGIMLKEYLKLQFKPKMILKNILLLVGLFSAQVLLGYAVAILKTFLILH